MYTYICIHKYIYFPASLINWIKKCSLYLLSEAFTPFTLNVIVISGLFLPSYFMLSVFYLLFCLFWGLSVLPYTVPFIPSSLACKLYYFCSFSGYFRNYKHMKLSYF